MAHTARHGLARRWSLWYQEYPVLLSPVWSQPAFPLGFDISSLDNAIATLELMRPVLPANLLGTPAAVVPAGMADGLPVGVQVMGGKYTELRCLAVAEAIDQDCRFDGVQRGGPQGFSGAARAGDGSGSGDTRGLRRSDHGRLEFAPRMHRGAWTSRRFAVIKAIVPLAEMLRSYATHMRSSTQGRAEYSMHFARYEEAPRSVAEEIIAKVQGTTK